MVVGVFVIDFKPLGFELILGINGISALGEVTIFLSFATCFGLAKTDEKPVWSVAMNIEKPVFSGAIRLMSWTSMFRLTLQRKLGRLHGNCRTTPSRKPCETELPSRA